MSASWRASDVLRALALAVVVLIVAGCLLDGVWNGRLILVVLTLVPALLPDEVYTRRFWVGGACLDCRDGRHLSCEGCPCPVDHSIEEYLAALDDEADDIDLHRV
jgi:hypothetical protein